MKLLVINWQDRLNPMAGGAEVHLHALFGRLSARGHAVTLLVSGWSGGAPLERVDGMEVHRVGSRHTFPLHAARFYRRHLAGRDYDLVVEDLNKVALWTPLWARSPVVLLVHHLFGSTAFSTASLPVATVTWLAERPLPLVYGRRPVQVVSESTRDDLVARGFHRERIRIVHNGVDLAFFRPDPAVPRTAVPTMLFVGRLQRYKRVDLLVRALRLVRAQGIEGRLIIAGRGPEERRLRDLARAEGVADHVDFRGFVDEETKRELLRSAWVHVITSPKEGWGLSVMEAAACATPTIASDSPGLRDSVVHRQTGLLVPSGDLSALGESLAALLGDRDEVERMGGAALARAGEFSWERSADLAERHFEDCLRNPD